LAEPHTLVSGRTLLGVGIVLCGLLLALGALVRNWLPLPSANDFYPVRYTEPQPAISGLPTAAVRDARAILAPGEMVLGVTVGSEARAYPINLLNGKPSHKVLNDTLGGTPIAATWCDACHNGIVFVREIDGRTLTLAPSGQLWKDSMVFYDRETGSLWSHLLGEAMQGPLRGKRLRKLPAVLTDWETWSARYPEGTVTLIPYGSREFNRGFYHDAEQFVLGVAEGESAKAWSLARLRQERAINDDWEGQPVVALVDRAGITARLYERRLADRVLTFRITDSCLADNETDSTWDPVTGRALTGPLAGLALTAVPAIVSFRDAWLRFHPGSQ
jgi:hypothetical protein